MQRREFLQCAALLTAGTGVVPAGWSLSNEQSKMLAAQPDYIDQHEPALFSDAQRRAVSAAADQIIPRTDTPGALDARVPRFIELMAERWFTDEERDVFVSGLDALLAEAGGDFAGLDPAAQLALLEALEEEAGDSTWYEFFSTMRVWDESAPFICQLKELVVLGFMLSEVGSTQFLRTNPMGEFVGDIPLAPDDSAYVKDTLARTLAREGASS